MEDDCTEGVVDFVEEGSVCMGCDVCGMLDPHCTCRPTRRYIRKNRIERNRVGYDVR